MQIFSYFEHMQIVQNLQCTKIFTWDYEIIWFFLSRQVVIYYGAPDVPVNMVAFQGVLVEGPGKFKIYKFQI